MDETGYRRTKKMLAHLRLSYILIKLFLFKLKKNISNIYDILTASYLPRKKLSCTLILRYMWNKDLSVKRWSGRWVEYLDGKVKANFLAKIGNQNP